MEAKMREETVSEGGTESGRGITREKDRYKELIEKQSLKNV